MLPRPVTVLIIAPAGDPASGPLVRLLDEARTALGAIHRTAFEALGAADVRVIREPPDGEPFGSRLRRLVAGADPGGVVVLGASSLALATSADRAAFLAAAGGHALAALANNRHSADAIAIACVRDALRNLPPTLATDNALPRWLAQGAAIPVTDLAARRHLAFDVDSPLDLLLLEGWTAAADGVLPLPDAAAAAPVRACLGALRRIARDPAAELLLAGRLSAADLRWLERGTRSRTRVLVEERGLRTAGPGGATGGENRRPPRSLLADAIDREGPASLGSLVARFSDGALIDTRVLIAARSGPDERAWPSAEDRFASDLLLPDRVRDPWLRALTASALEAPVPVLLGAHTLVGPGSRLALGGPRRASR